MQTSRTFNADKCRKKSCTNCFMAAAGCLLERGDSKTTARKRIGTGISLVLVVLKLMSGCSHSQWVIAKDATQLAAFMNPLGFAIHIGAAAGAMFTEPDNNQNQE